jgi:hypothetical protein
MPAETWSSRRAYPDERRFIFASSIEGGKGALRDISASGSYDSGLAGLCKLLLMTAFR